MDLRLLQLDHRAAGIGQLVQFLVQRLAEGPDAFDRVLVIVVGNRGGEQLGQDGAELDRLFGQPLRGLPHRGILQIAGADRADDPRQYAGFEIVVQDVAARLARGAHLIRLGSAAAREPGHMGQGIALPAHAADLLVEMRVAIGDDIEPGGLLRAQIDRDRILVLLAPAQIHHRFEKLEAPRLAVHQEGRGNDPMIEVGKVRPADPLNIFSPYDSARAGAVTRNLARAGRAMTPGISHRPVAAPRPGSRDDQRPLGGNDPRMSDSPCQKARTVQFACPENAGSEQE